ncbi:PREDICTED: sperm flagellar protein 1-like [Polistes canadensis]|uniref:sperm flagellar protein 1-like n=1 Tax=Polistes canadensis TaxID=91411 RepID=UPI000718BED6|nr:PREDICTED: sperm flagellar protein 1-like [Polistes canadensis]
MNDIKDMNDEYGNDQNDHSRELCAWIESIPFSKPKKNLSPLSLYRDFSDGVLLAEILKVYYPRYVDIHNYISANNYFLKKENWNTLNRKVLTKIDIKLNKDIISQLVNDKKVEVDQEDEHVPRQICIQLKQELREKDNLICTLNHQIAYLEGAMKLKDLRISGLMSKINSNSYSH